LPDLIYSYAGMNSWVSFPSYTICNPLYVVTKVLFPRVRNP
jgi:hypothetical protein